MIYRVFGTFGPFYILAVISLATLVLGFLPAYVKRPPKEWLRQHYDGMCWSYVGLLAATAAEIAVRLPISRGSGLSFGLATFVASVVVVFIGGIILSKSRDRVLADFQPPMAQAIEMSVDRAVADERSAGDGNS